MARKPSVLFVCVKNGGKSQMAAGLMRHAAGDESPKAIDPAIVRDVDLVVTLGREANVEYIAGTAFENWDTDEPSLRGIDGIERMRLVRDDIAARVEARTRRLAGESLLSDDDE